MFGLSVTICACDKTLSRTLHLCPITFIYLF